MGCPKGVFGGCAPEGGSAKMLSYFLSAESCSRMAKAGRDHLIYETYSRYGYSMSAIARELGLHDSTISKIIKAQKYSGFKA